MTESERLFGVELEFSLTDNDGRPVLQSAAPAVADGRAAGLQVATEQGSFQIELNPGPWPLTPTGIEAGMSELRRQTKCLSAIARRYELVLRPCAMPPILDPALIVDERFVTSHARYQAFAKYFASHSATLRFASGEALVFPGERAIACINEIHVHISLGTQAATLALFRNLNEGGSEFASKFLDRPVVNGKPVIGDYPTLQLFQEANFELSPDGTMNRVGFLPVSVATFDDYMNAVRDFPAIPGVAGGEHLAQEQTVYFWVRMRKENERLRLEYRPMDMCESWEERVRTFLDATLDLAGPPNGHNA